MKEDLLIEMLKVFNIQFEKIAYKVYFRPWKIDIIFLFTNSPMVMVCYKDSLPYKKPRVGLC